MSKAVQLTVRLKICQKLSDFISSIISVQFLSTKNSPVLSIQVQTVVFGTIPMGRYSSW